MSAASHLRSFQALELAVRLGSLKAAADELAITPAAVGQRIKLLEDHLGVDLIVRSRMGLKASPALGEALPHLHAAFRELTAAADSLDLQAHDEIHVAADGDWVKLWLAPRLDDFRASYPNIRFCINGEGDAPLRLGKADIEVRFGPIPENEDVEFLFRDYIAPICGPDNKGRLERSRRRGRLDGLPLLHVDFYKDDPEAIDWRKWIAKYGDRSAGGQRGFRFQRIAAAVDAAKSDAGFMLCGVALVVADVAAGELVLPFPAKHGAWTSHGFCADFRVGRARAGRKQAHLRRLREWMADEAAATRRDIKETIGV